MGYQFHASKSNPKGEDETFFGCQSDEHDTFWRVGYFLGDGRLQFLRSVITADPVARNNLATYYF